MTTEAERMAGYLENDGNDCKCAAYGACECACGANWAEYHVKDAAKLLRSQAAEIEHLKFALNQESLARENVSQMRAEFASKLDKSEALLRQALEALEKTRAFHQQNWSSEEITPKLTRDTIAAIKQHLGEDHGN